MSNFTITPNMNLIVPNVGVNGDPGPDYANNQNQDLQILDGHNHGPGSGVPVTPTGLNINANLPFNGFNITGIYGLQFSNPTSSSLLAFLYTNSQTGGGITDLFYNDGAGNVIALTKAGEVNATIASIPGESYSGGTFTWVQGNGSTTPANFDIGSITIRPNTAGTTNGVVLGPPSAIASQYNIQLPTIPGSGTNILTIDSSGNMASQTYQVAGDNLGQAMTSVGANAIANTRTRSTGSSIEGVGGVCVSADSGSFSSSGIGVPVTNMNVTLTTSGRPVMIMFIATPSPINTSSIGFSANSDVSFSLWYNTVGTGTLINNIEFASSAAQDYAPGQLNFLDTSVSGVPGTYNYLLGCSVTAGTIFATHITMIAYEI